MESPVDAIRERYPMPMSVNTFMTLHRRMKDPYCVLGALTLYYHIGIAHFPGIATSVIALRNANCNLNAEIARGYYVKISGLNDSGNFEAAWSLLNEALLYGKQAS